MKPAYKNVWSNTCKILTKLLSTDALLLVPTQMKTPTSSAGTCNVLSVEVKESVVPRVATPHTHLPETGRHGRIA